MRLTVPRICETLVASRLLAADEVEALRRRWTTEAGGVDDPGRFTRWLVAHRYVTEFQAALLVHGHADHFFIGPYKLLDRMARGRLAVVYAAVHRLGQKVALKVLPPSKARDSRLLARFRREAELALRLDHPHVVRAFEAGEADGLHYLVMEYLEGETLEALLRRRGQLPLEEAVWLIRQALLGLQHLHERGLVHRNLEPANLMVLTGLGPDPILKILDISLGRSLFDDAAPAAARQLALTYEGVILGTPTYLAPEQARDAHAADIRADIYSLGCILYQMLAGQPPFVDASPIRLAILHATETPQPLGERNPAVPDGLQQIIDGMLAKDPAQRYATPEQVVQALDAFLLAGSPPPAETMGPSPAVVAEAPGEPPLTADAPEPLPAFDLAPELLPSPAWKPPTARLRRPIEEGNGRIYLALLLGGMGLLLAETIGWMLARLLVR
jgi:serine/threonine protein kinase